MKILGKKYLKSTQFCRQKYMKQLLKVNQRKYNKCLTKTTKQSPIK